MRTRWRRGYAAGSGHWLSVSANGPTASPAGLKFERKEYHMTDSTGPHLENPIDGYVSGELNATEARELAQKSLDDPKLFEDLTFLAVAKAALATPSAASQLGPPGAGAKVVRFPRKLSISFAA